MPEDTGSESTSIQQTVPQVGDRFLIQHEGGSSSAPKIIDIKDGIARIEKPILTAMPEDLRNGIEITRLQLRRAATENLVALWGLANQ